MNKKCKLCKKLFSPLKSYYKVCTECLPNVRGCKRCKKLVIPNEDNILKCCGIQEPMRDSSRSWPVGWHKEEWELLLSGLSEK